MTLHAAWKMDAEGAAAARQEIALIKFYGAGVLHDVVDRALQVHGALGYSTDLPLEAMYRFARAARIYDGPDEVHRQSVARRILRGYEAPADGVPASTSRRAARPPRALRRPARGGDLQRLGRRRHRHDRRARRRRRRAVLALAGRGRGDLAEQTARPPPRPPRARTASTPRARGSTCATRSSSACARPARRSSRARGYLRERLPRGHYESVPGHPGLRNVVGRIPGRKPAVVLAAHYDTKDLPGFVGANDGAGGTAAVLEIAARAAQAKRPKGAPEIRFVFFDGEEATDDSRPFEETELRGSKAYARSATPRRSARSCCSTSWPRRAAMRIPREAALGRRLWRRLRAAAKRVGSAEAFVRRRAARSPTTTRRSCAADPGDRPDRLHVPLLAQDLRRHLGRLGALAGPLGRGRPRAADRGC